MKKNVYLGVDIGGTYIKIAVVNHSGKVLSRGVIETEWERGAGDAFRRIRAALTTLLGRDERVAAAGIGCAGLVDSDRGILLTSPNIPTWKRTPLRRIAERKIGVHIFVDNDANAAAYGEYKCGAGRGCENLVCITLGTGVGGAIVSGGRLLKGSANYAGEIGHMSVNMNGPRCKCGNRGCLEAYIGRDALVRSAREKLKVKRGRVLGKLSTHEMRVMTPKVIFQAALQGDRVAKEVFSEASRYLGAAIASLVNMLNPEVVVLSGGVSGAFEFMKPQVVRVVHERAFTESAEMVKITRAALGSDSSTIGAALFAKERIKKGTKDPHR